MTEDSQLPSPHVLIVQARFYEDIADELVRGAVTALEALGVTYDICEVPGAFEIPAAIGFAADAWDRQPWRRPIDGFIALGCVIRGETTHYDYVWARAAVDGKNKGGDAAAACLAMIALRHRFGVNVGAR